MKGDLDISSSLTINGNAAGTTINGGALSPGHYADMVAVANDPLADISALEHIDHVMKGGAIVR